MCNRILLVAVACCFSFVGPVHGQGPLAGQPSLASFQLYWENDTFLPTDTSDKFYTNGIKVAWIRNPNKKEPPMWVEKFLDRWCIPELCPNAKAEYGYGHAVGQSFYTPESIVDPNPQPHDHPWAGYLYFSWILQSTYPTEHEQSVQNLFDVQVGLVGPGAGARFSQSTVHKLIDSPEPLGWSNQLRNEPTLNLIYLWRKRIGTSTLDVVPDFGGGLGNVMTYANAGATVRLGYHISSFPQVLITPTNAMDTSKPPSALEFYLFAGGDGRAVARNIFLDGNTFRDGPEILIDRKDFVFDTKFGFALRYKALRLDYTLVHRSEEFVPPRGRANEDHKFGAFAISWGLWRKP